MAKTSAPLFGFDAAGSLGKAVVFAKWRGVSYARKHVIPANPQTAAQSLTRDLFATLNEMWKVADANTRAPWDAFASGRPFTGNNKWVGENIRVNRGQADFQLFIGSPGARGGLPPESVLFTTGAGSGEVDADFVNPTPPAGWVLESEVAVAFPDQVPDALWGGPLVAGIQDPPTGNIVLAGLGSAVPCVVAGWITWTKPNLDIAFSVGVTGTATSGV